MEKIYSVYLHTNKINGKRYVGMTKLPTKTRWGSNGQGYKNQPRFYNDIQKYGWDNFNHEVLYSGLTKPEAQMKEVGLIKEYNTRDEEYGYNKNGAEYDENGVAIYTGNHHKYYYKPKEKEKLIHCIELDLVFKTTTSAGEATKTDSSSISKACRGVRKSAGKHPVTKTPLHWEYIDIQEVK